MKALEEMNSGLRTLKSKVSPRRPSYFLTPSTQFQKRAGGLLGPSTTFQKYIALAISRPLSEGKKGPLLLCPPQQAWAGLDPGEQPCRSVGRAPSLVQKFLLSKEMGTGTT